MSLLSAGSILLDSTFKNNGIEKYTFCLFCSSHSG
jgi:hypothetical protein